MNLNILKFISFLIPIRKYRKFFYKYLSSEYETKIPLSKADKLKIKGFKDKYKGQRCFIIGGAPSLSQLDLSKLANEKTFIVNRGYLLKDKGLKNSTFHVHTDLDFNREFHDEIDLDFSEYFISLKQAKWKHKKDRIKIAGALWQGNFVEIFFQEDCSKKIILAVTVVAIAIQLAVYMGFKEIILIGVDLSFDENNNHFYKSSDEEKNRVQNHSIRYKHYMYQWLENTFDLLDKKGIKLLNASPKKDSLKFMTKVNFDSLFKEKK